MRARGGFRVRARVRVGLRVRVRVRVRLGGLLRVEAAKPVDAQAHLRESLCERAVDLALTVGELREREAEAGHGGGERAVALDVLLGVLVHRGDLRLESGGVVTWLGLGLGLG